jgi:RNA polymerase sigma-70 factor, ECF subfamily
MSSEAAYFPDALASVAEVREPLKGSPATSSNIPNDVQPNTSERCGCNVTSIAEISDEALLEQVCQGVKEALGILFRRHARTVRNVACRILRDEAEADDLVQEVFLFIYSKAALFDASRGTARSWIIHVTYHRSFDRRRYLNSRHFYTNQELEETCLRLAGAHGDPSIYEQSIEGIFGKEVTARFNDRLTFEQREIIQLYFFEGHTLKEVAERTGRSLVNVRNHYYRGLDRLRKHVLLDTPRSK